LRDELGVEFGERTVRPGEKRRAESDPDAHENRAREQRLWSGGVIEGRDVRKKNVPS
jgi:hypothetical protein